MVRDNARDGVRPAASPWTDGRTVVRVTETSELTVAARAAPGSGPQDAAGPPARDLLHVETVLSTPVFIRHAITTTAWSRSMSAMVRCLELDGPDRHRHEVRQLISLSHLRRERLAGAAADRIEQVAALGPDSATAFRLTVRAPARLMRHVGASRSAPLRAHSILPHVSTRGGGASPPRRSQGRQASR